MEPLALLRHRARMGQDRELMKSLLAHALFALLIISPVLYVAWVGSGRP
jgi:hypothetical protein